jgi:hypothetical protein
MKPLNLNQMEALNGGICALMPDPAAPACRPSLCQVFGLALGLANFPNPVACPL